MARELERLMEWYAAQCDGDWEHQHGVRVDTLDNPGWSLEVSLVDTSVAGKSYAWKRIEIDPNDWVSVKVANDKFLGWCGPGNLVEMLGLFLDFVHANEP